MNNVIDEVRAMLEPQETFKCEFRGNALEVETFRTECARLRIPTVTSITALNMTEKQSQSIHNLATAIIVK